MLFRSATASHDNPLSPIQILGVNPGVNIPVSAAVVAGAGTITATGPTDTIMRGADTAWYNADMVIGSPEANNDGDPNHDARIIWDKVNYAFRAGKATGTEWDAGNRGKGSIAMGIDCKASGDASIAMGNVAVATHNDAIALGTAAHASANKSVAIMGSVAQGIQSIAVGENAGALDDDSIAIGSSAAANSVASKIGRAHV